MKNLALDVESIALALSEEGGYEYYHIDDDLRELAKDVSDMQAENAKLREQVDAAHMSRLLTENENESLRELVAKYSAAAKYLCGYSHCNECNLDCASVFDDVPSGWDCARMLLDKRARELGAEVDA